MAVLNRPIEHTHTINDVNWAFDNRDNPDDARHWAMAAALEMVAAGLLTTRDLRDAAKTWDIDHKGS